MARPRASAVSTVLTWSLLAASSAVCEDIRDVTFWTPYASGRPTTANFYYNDRAIGAGREGFAAIVERIGKLPAGTSVVWGPNYDRCGACSGREPDCVPKFLYPDLWEQLETLVAERRLLLSSRYPAWGSWRVGLEDLHRLPPVVSADDPAAREPFDGVLDWEVGDIVTKEATAPERSVVYGARWHRFSSGGKLLAGFERDLLFGLLPEQSRVLIRVALHDDVDIRNDDNNPQVLFDLVRAVWRSKIDGELRSGKLTATLTAPAELADALRAAPDDSRLTIGWSNFRGPQTPTEEVLFYLNEEFVGRGGEGIDRILAGVDQLPPGAEVILPQYESRTFRRTNWLPETRRCAG